ncbi:putative metal-binding motif-containing protein [Silanimonas lenta]|uniref:putative metal-binding motif-containing protein n=1 Tax=Silanimonas lenta TaxID=265429 RepID=UPI000405A324|nr:putative metal-binding motif-containing protein [Silanimonas lenta]
MPRPFLTAALLGLAALSPALATTTRNFSPALAPVLENSRDYVRVDELPAKSLGKSITDAGCNPCWGQVVRYTTFSTPQQTYEARRYDGKEVVLLVPVDHPRAARATPERIRTLVDQYDLLYAVYEELLGWRPNRSRDPLGRQIAAILPNDRSDWYGLAFVPGDSAEYVNAVLDEPMPDDDLIGNVWVHELAHNFDPIGHWDYGPDPAHDWTTFMQVWTARRMARMDDNGRSRWDRSEASQTTQRWANWFANPALTWQRCAVENPRPQDCRDEVNTLTGVLMATLARHVDDPATIRQWLRTVRTDPTRPSGAEARSDYLLRTLADATRTDTRCAADHFRWYRGPGLDAAGQYPTPFPGCRDGDGDGFRRFDDCEDTRADVRPGAPELADGRDNDCNGIVDERLVREADFGGDFSNNGFAGTPIGRQPVAVEGAMPTTSDQDAIRFDNPLPVGRAQVRLCATGDRMRLAGLAIDNVLWAPLATAEPGRCASLGSNDRAYRGFRVERTGTTSGSASWRLEIGEAAEGWPRPRPVTLTAAGDNGVRAVVDAARVPGGTAGVELRWTGSGAGVLKALPLSNPDSLVAPPLPAALMDRSSTERLQLRAQLFRNGLPVEAPTRPFSVNTEGFALSPGVTVAARLRPGSSEERWYIDVPPGTTRLSITTSSAQNIDLYAARIAAPQPAAAPPLIAAAPARSEANARATTASGNETLVVNAPAPGRWYLTPVHAGSGSEAAYTLRASLEGTIVPPRPGSYFNPGRPGHGLFVHPAGDDWAALWYAYDDAGQPTWYYLQGPAPGATAHWNGTLYRARWDGLAAQLHPVGNAVLSPDGPDGLTFSYNLDGLAGSEAFRPLGRGCPPIGGGAPVNASQHYFDPARAGSGYSVQLMSSPAAYEFYAAFVYDAQGQPRFVVAERTGAGARDEAVPLEQIRGFCPLCVHSPVVRRSAGSLRRTYSAAGVLETIQLQASFSDGLTGSWTVTDAVRMLDPRNRPQGCQP